MTTPCSFEDQPNRATITATTRPVAAVTVAMIDLIDLFISRVSIGLPHYLLPYARSLNSAAAVSLRPNTDGVGFHQGVVGAIEHELVVESRATCVRCQGLLCRRF